MDRVIPFKSGNVIVVAGYSMHRYLFESYSQGVHTLAAHLVEPRSTVSDAVWKPVPSGVDCLGSSNCKLNRPLLMLRNTKETFVPIRHLSFLMGLED